MKRDRADAEIYIPLALAIAVLSFIIAFCWRIRKPAQNVLEFFVVWLPEVSGVQMLLFIMYVQSCYELHRATNGIGRGETTVLLFCCFLFVVPTRGTYMK